MKILIIKLSSIGDVVHTLPSLQSIRNAYLSAEIDWLVEEEAGNILEGNPMISEIFIIKKNGWLKDFRSTYNVFRRIRKTGYDIVLDFQGLFKSGIWVFLSKGKRRIGFDKSREMSYIFLNEKLPPYDPDKHAVDRYLDIAEYIGGRRDAVEFLIPISEHEKEKVPELLKANGIVEGERFVIVSPAARWETKLWEAGKFAGLCNEIIDRLLCKVVIVGSTSAGEVARITSLTDERVINLAGKTTLKELAYLMSLSSLVIAVDSGPMHIAAAMAVPVVAIFGPTAPWRTGPYGTIHAIIRKELPCSPCFSRVCDNKDKMCMRGIEVRDVMRAVEAQLNFKLQNAKTAEKGNEETGKSFSLS